MDDFQPFPDAEPAPQTKREQLLAQIQQLGKMIDDQMDLVRMQQNKIKEQQEKIQEQEQIIREQQLKLQQQEMMINGNNVVERNIDQQPEPMLDPVWVITDPEMY